MASCTLCINPFNGMKRDSIAKIIISLSVKMSSFFLNASFNIYVRAGIIYVCGCEALGWYSHQNSFASKIAIVASFVIIVVLVGCVWGILRVLEDRHGSAEDGVAKKMSSTGDGNID
jgi:hypothetical protein